MPNCDDSPSIYFTTNSIPNYIVGCYSGSYTVYREWEAIDACGNSSGVERQTITITDKFPPVITGSIPTTGKSNRELALTISTPTSRAKKSSLNAMKTGGQRTRNFITN